MWKLSPLCKEDDLIQSGMHKHYDGFYYSDNPEVKKGVAIYLAVDLETRNVWLSVDNDNVVPPDEMIMGGEYHEDGEVVMLEREVRQKYQFTLSFEFPKSFYILYNQLFIYWKKEN